MESFKEVGGWTFVLGCPRKLVEGVLGCFRNLEVPGNEMLMMHCCRPGNLSLTFLGHPSSWVGLGLEKQGRLGLGEG